MGYDFDQKDISLLIKIVHLLSTSNMTTPLLSNPDLSKLLLDLFQADFLGTTQWDAASNKYINPVCYNRDDKMSSSYRDYYQFLDPISSKLRAHQSANVIYKAISKSELRKTEYYNDFLKANDLSEGVDLYFCDGGQIVGDLRVWRSTRSKPLCGKEELLLDSLKPYLLNYFRMSQFASSKPMGGNSSREFSLTAREKQVLTLVIQGQSDKFIARHLNISYWTVRSNITNLLTKTGTKNRNELSYLVSCFSKNTDPSRVIEDRR